MLHTSAKIYSKPFQIKGTSNLVYLASLSSNTQKCPCGPNERRIIPKVPLLSLFLAMKGGSYFSLLRKDGTRRKLHFYLFQRHNDYEAFILKVGLIFFPLFVIRIKFCCSCCSFSNAGISYTLSRSGRPAIFARDPDGNALEFTQVD